MNIIAKSNLNFQGIQLQPVAGIADTWLTAAQIGYALQYADDKAVQRIYSRHTDEFTEQMTGVVKLTTPYGEQRTRAFSLRGAHLIAMFARTPVAKQFRRWVLDILEQQEMKQVPSRQFTDEELRTLCLLWSHSVNMLGNIADIAPLLRVAEHRLAAEFSAMPHLYVNTLNNARAMLERETLHIDISGEADRDWRILDKLRLGKYASLFGA
ncbi:Bro-N domain-containing protein [Pantoea dispersa]|uniref:BRO-N domain-containing protein n=1 Tax=Pantoea dispersa TaxID=59814 RepID=UPI0023A982C6|nr:Bro-N domain-containing protein [Pantoea dispersa]WEA06950.1 Bro-N domain-containing protein [Pantoea dispersa]